jgi:hypothetical protein
MKLHWHRLNSAVCLMVCLQIQCPECLSEFEVTDNIEGGLFEGALCCVKCGASISLRNENSPKVAEKIESLLDEFLRKAS